MNNAYGSVSIPSTKKRVRSLSIVRVEHPKTTTWQWHLANLLGYAGTPGGSHETHPQLER